MRTEGEHVIIVMKITPADQRIFFMSSLRNRLCVFLVLSWSGRVKKTTPATRAILTNAFKASSKRWVCSSEWTVCRWIWSVCERLTSCVNEQFAVVNEVCMTSAVKRFYCPRVWAPLSLVAAQNAEGTCHRYGHV